MRHSATNGHSPPPGAQQTNTMVATVRTQAFAAGTGARQHVTMMLCTASGRRILAVCISLSARDHSVAARWLQC